MKPSELLAKWLPVQLVFRKAGTWLELIRLASAGDEGVSISEWARRLGGHPPCRRVLNKWLRAGLVDFTEAGPAGQMKRLWRVTPKGLLLLSLEP